MQRSSSSLFSLCLLMPTIGLEWHFTHSAVMHPMVIGKKLSLDKKAKQLSNRAWSHAAHLFPSVLWILSGCEIESKTSNYGTPKRTVLWVTLPQIIVQAFTWLTWCSTEGNIRLDFQRSLYPKLLCVYFTYLGIFTMHKLIEIMSTVKGRFLAESRGWWGVFSLVET